MKPIPIITTIASDLEITSGPEKDPDVVAIESPTKGAATARANKSERISLMRRADQC
jgi:hypothetical protein